MSVALMGAVYVVDPDASVREALSRLVGAEGLHVVPCQGVDDALERWGGSSGACLLLDCSGARHWSASYRSRLRTIACALPIIAISGEPEPGTRRIARRIGAQAFFSKPVDAGALLDAIAWATHAEGAGPPE